MLFCFSFFLTLGLTDAFFRGTPINRANGVAPPGHYDSIANVSGCCECCDCRPLIYNNGTVRQNTVNVYVMWYGNWDAPSQNLIINFLQNYGGTPRYTLTTTFPIKPPNGQILYKNSVTHNPHNYPTSITETDVANLIDAETTWQTKDPNGLYMFLSSNDTMIGSPNLGYFCSDFCGFHDNYTNTAGVNVVFAVIGNPAYCMNNCSAGGSLGTGSPNGLPPADSMISTIAHETEESTTDPFGDGYFSAGGQECGDLCAWTFGTYSLDGNGAAYNVQVGTNNYLIQQGIDFENVDTQVCAMYHTAVALPTGSPTKPTPTPTQAPTQAPTTHAPVSGAPTRSPSKPTSPTPKPTSPTAGQDKTLNAGSRSFDSLAFAGFMVVATGLAFA